MSRSVLAAALLAPLVAFGAVPSPEQPEQPAPIAPPPPTAKDAAEPRGDVLETFGKGVTFVARDGLLTVNLRARFQFRFSETWLQEEHEELFEIRRARLLLRGLFLRKELEYYIQLGFAERDMEPERRTVLRDAYLTWSPLRDLTVRGGQMKVPFGKQRRTSSGSLQFVDRSLATGELNLDRDVGLVLASADLGGLGGRLAYQLGIFGGNGRNTPTPAPGLLSVARVSVKPFGKFDDLVESDLERHRTPKLAVGSAVAFNDGSERVRSTIGGIYDAARFDFLHVEADLHFKWRGVSLLAEWLMRDATTDAQTNVVDGTPVTELSRSATGWYAQAGVLLPRVRGTDVELVARFGEVNPMEGTDPSFRRSSELGGGANWYVSGHDFKLQLDLFRLWSRDFDDGSTAFRLQTQMWF